jgi:hypothetical protein
MCEADETSNVFTKHEWYVCCLLCSLIIINRQERAWSLHGQLYSLLQDIIIMHFGANNIERQHLSYSGLSDMARKGHVIITECCAVGI